MERRNRIILSIAAYAYEVENDSIMLDHEFDEKCKSVNLNVNTGNRKLDNWFKKHFDPSTGQWIHKHPELNRIKQLYRKYYSKAED